MNHSPPARRELFLYGFLALPLAFAGLPLYIHAPDFYVRELGISIGTIGIILIALRLFDAFQDPLIGFFSDTLHRKRLLMVNTGILLLTIGMAGVFYGPQYTVNTNLWFIVSMLIATTGFSIASINLNQIGGFWSEEPKQRTRIAAWREAIALLGLLTASFLPTLLQNRFGPNIGFVYLFWIFLCLILLATLSFNIFYQRKQADLKQVSSDHSRFEFISLYLGENRQFFLVCFLAQLASSLPAVLVLFFIRDYLNVDHLAGLFLFLYFMSGILFIGLWTWLANIYGKYTAWLISMVLSIITFISVLTLQTGDTYTYGLICIFSGMALGADLSIPPSILADRVSTQKNHAISTQYYAALGFIPKICISLASGVSFLILDYLGFQVDSHNSQTALSGLLLLYGLVPCLIKVIASIFLFHIHKHQGDYYANFERSYSNGNVNVS